MNNVWRVLLTLVVSVALTILLCALCVGSIQLVRYLCKRLRRAINAERPYVLELPDSRGRRRCSDDSSTEGKFDNFEDKRDSGDVHDRVVSKSSEFCNTTQVDARIQDNGALCRDGYGAIGQSCSSNEGRDVVSGNDGGGTNETIYGYQTTATTLTKEILSNQDTDDQLLMADASHGSAANNAYINNSIETLKTRNLLCRTQDTRRASDGQTIINMYANDHREKSISNLTRNALRDGRNFMANAGIQTGRCESRESRVLELVQYTASPRVPGRKEHEGRSISTVGATMPVQAHLTDVPSLSRTDDGTSPFQSCLDESIVLSHSSYLNNERLEDGVNYDSIAESQHYESARYDFDHSTPRQHCNSESQTSINRPLNLFDCDRVVPSERRHYPFRHEIEDRNAISTPNLFSSSEACSRGSRRLSMDNALHYALPEYFEDDIEFDDRRHMHARSASISADERKTQQASSTSQSTIFTISAHLNAPFSTEGNRFIDVQCRSNASQASTLQLQEVRRSQNRDPPASVINSLRYLGPEHRYLSLDVSNLKECEEPPAYSELPPPTYIEAMLNDHHNKQREILERRKTGSELLKSSEV